MKPTLNQTPDFSSFPKPKNESKFVVKCVLAILLIASGLLSTLLFNSITSGLMRIVAGLLLFPPTLKALESGIKVTLNRIARYVVIILLVQVSLIISFYSLIKESSNAKLNNRKADSTTKTLSLPDTSKVKQNAESNTVGLDSDSIPTDSLNKLAKEEQYLVERQKILQQQKEEFKEKYLSGWDGSFSPLVKYVKDNMNEPDSFEHVSTNLNGQGDHIVIAMKFKSKNAFGVKVVNIIRANVSFDGQIIEIIK